MGQLCRYSCAKKVIVYQNQLQIKMQNETLKTYDRNIQRLHSDDKHFTRTAWNIPRPFARKHSKRNNGKKRKKEITSKNNSQRNICKASGTRSLIQATQKQLWLENNGPESRFLHSAGFFSNYSQHLVFEIIFKYSFYFTGKQIILALKLRVLFH